MTKLFWVGQYFASTSKTGISIRTNMNITIGKPYAVSEIGGRQKNEDAVFPSGEYVHATQRLFLVCDGVGGAEKGEVASALACESIQMYFSSFLDGDPTPAFINKAIQYTETRFDEYVVQHPEARGMATTMTLLYVGLSGIVLAHVGDSRIYQFRNGKPVYQTADHSLVYSLYQLGKITEDEMYDHPQRNVILRAIQGSERPVEADVITLKDIQAGDCFLMCTDGVLERFSTSRLSSVFSTYKSLDLVKDSILQECTGKTRDNFSFYLVPVHQVQEHVGIRQNILSFLYSFI